MWHKGEEKVEARPNGKIRFQIPRDSARQRQVIAFQQSYRPEGSEIFPPYGTLAIRESPEAMHLLGQLWSESRTGGSAKKFTYKPSVEIVDALRPKYQSRLDDNFRQAGEFQLNGYTLGQFKSFYIALLILCSIHEYICYPFDKPGQPIPASSLVMVKSRQAWVWELSAASGIPSSICEAIVADLTLNPVAVPGTSMCISPFVPLDTWTLAVAPQFPLASAVDDNALRSFSYLYPSLFSAQNGEKEAVMRQRVKEAVHQFPVQFSIELPNKSTEIDVLIADEASSTLVFVELKWSRKPNRTLERIPRDKDIAKGITQLRLIRAYARQYPKFLAERGRLPRSIDSYANVHYLLAAWDHWYWIEPEDALAVVNFDVLLPLLKMSTNLQDSVKQLLSYDWLPVENRDFRVQLATSSVNGAEFESPIFSPVT
jgi:hypothetical protein